MMGKPKHAMDVERVPEVHNPFSDAVLPQTGS